jgi:hypothetical protein
MLGYLCAICCLPTPTNSPAQAVIAGLTSQNVQPWSVQTAPWLVHVHACMRLSAACHPHTTQRCRMLFKYVTEVEPSVVDTFARTGPPQVVDAFHVTVVGLVGTLPPQFFEVNITTLGDNLRSLMYSFLMTGYFYRHVVDKLEMKRGLDRALPGSLLQDDLEQDVKPGMRLGLRSETLDGFAQVRTWRWLCSSCLLRRTRCRTTGEICVPRCPVHRQHCFFMACSC